jgi:ACS family hexuronate transporter-like MFS transporter
MVLACRKNQKIYNVPMAPMADNMKLSKMRWVMIAMAFLATVLNYIHRLSFNYLSADGDLRKLISDDAFGYIGTAFFIAYMLSNAFSGLVIDKLGTKLGYSLCMAFWTTAGLVHAFAITPLQFGICRFFLGIGEAGNWPAALKLTGEWFPPHERSTASGIFNSGSALGAIIVPPLIAVMSTHYGWQSTFIMLAVLGYLWLVIFWFLYYTPGHSIKESKARIIPPFKLLKNRFVSRLLLAKIFIEPVWYFVTFWIGRYLVDVHHWDLKKNRLVCHDPFYNG